MFDYLNKKIIRSITIAVISVLTIECFTVFLVYSYLNIHDYTKKSEHICNQLSAYVELRLRSYEESTSFFISNYNFENLIKTNSPKTLNLFSQFIASNIGIQNVFIYDSSLSIIYENNNTISEYIAEKRQNKTNLPYWDIYKRNNNSTEMLVYSYPIKSSDNTDIATFVICISPELLSDNTVRQYENSMTQNIISFIGVNESKYCSINQDSRYYGTAKDLYKFSTLEQNRFEGFFRMSNSLIANSNLYLQTFVSLKSVFLNIFIMGIIIFSILAAFSILSYIIIRHYSKYLIDTLSSLSNKIENFSAKEL